MVALDLNMVLQIVLALIILIIIYIFTLVILNIDTIIVRNSNKVKPQETTTIVDGYAPVSYLGYKSYNTINQFGENFKKLGRSINTMGGAQFTYQFWLKIEDPNDALFKNLVLLLKGDDRKYKVGMYRLNPDATKGYSRYNTIPADYVITCPLIKFVDSYRHLRVQFNTANSPLTSIDINMNPNEAGLGRRNALSLLPLNWYMFTFVFEDNISIQNVQENGINFKFWLNDFSYQENGASDNTALRNNTIKQNDGDLYLLPNPPQNGTFLKLGNIKYYNYALNESDIQKTFAAGPPSKSTMELSDKGDIPPHLSAFNKIDIYNY